MLVIPLVTETTSVLLPVLHLTIDLLGCGYLVHQINSGYQWYWINLHLLFLLFVDSMFGVMEVCKRYWWGLIGDVLVECEVFVKDVS